MGLESIPTHSLLLHQRSSQRIRRPFHHPSLPLPARRQISMPTRINASMSRASRSASRTMTMRHARCPSRIRSAVAVCTPTSTILSSLPLTVLILEVNGAVWGLALQQILEQQSFISQAKIAFEAQKWECKRMKVGFVVTVQIFEMPLGKDSWASLYLGYLHRHWEYLYHNSNVDVWLKKKIGDEAKTHITKKNNRERCSAKINDNENSTRWVQEEEIQFWAKPPQESHDS